MMQDTQDYLTLLKINLNFNLDFVFKGNIMCVCYIRNYIYFKYKFPQVCR